jgi:hypothetical protein
MEDPFLNYFALGLPFFVMIVLVYGIIAIHDIPARIAHARHHRQDAIHAAGSGSACSRRRPARCWSKDSLLAELGTMDEWSKNGVAPAFCEIRMLSLPLQPFDFGERRRGKDL